MTEIWKDIQDYEGRYQISNTGKVKSLIGHEKILKFKKDKWDYLHVGLSKNNKSKKWLVHRLVAITFIPNPENKSEVNHIDGNKTNNHVENLEWCSHLENIRHAFKTGLNKSKAGEEAINHKLTWNDVHWIREHYIKGSRDFGTHAFARKFGIDQKEIREIVNNRKWKET